MYNSETGKMRSNKVRCVYYFVEYNAHAYTNMFHIYERKNVRVLAATVAINLGKVT